MTDHMGNTEGNTDDRADVSPRLSGRDDKYGPGEVSPVGPTEDVGPEPRDDAASVKAGAAPSVEHGVVSEPTDPVEEEDGLFPAPVSAAPHTGDDVIDSTLARLEESAASGSLDEQIEAGEKVHRTLQGRLADLGGE